MILNTKDTLHFIEFFYHVKSSITHSRTDYYRLSGETSHDLNNDEFEMESACKVYLLKQMMLSCRAVDLSALAIGIWSGNGEVA